RSPRALKREPGVDTGAGRDSISPGQEQGRHTRLQPQARGRVPRHGLQRRPGPGGEAGAHSLLHVLAQRLAQVLLGRLQLAHIGRHCWRQQQDPSSLARSFPPAPRRRPDGARQPRDQPRPPLLCRSSRPHHSCFRDAVGSRDTPPTRGGAEFESASAWGPALLGPVPGSAPAPVSAAAPAAPRLYAHVAPLRAGRCLSHSHAGSAARGRGPQFRGGHHVRPHPLPRLPGGLDINAYNGNEPTEKLPFPIIADANRELSVQLGMLDPDERDKDGMPLTARVVFIFGPDKKLKLSVLYPATTGRNFDEILRVVDSLQLTAYKKVATPVDWKPDTSVMVIPSLPDDEAKKLFPAGIFTKELPSGKKYLRYTPHPK
uniref:Peroxiredoxin 6 n=1 Tax=Crocodylus porosus TaxID=8502 RepID=A0A7M4E797_CROPO